MSDLALPYVVPPTVNPVLERIKYDNFLKTLKNRKDRVTRLDSRPFDLTMDLTSICQLGCPYCSTANGKLARQKSIMKDELHAFRSSRPTSAWIRRMDSFGSS